ncbi:MAG: T9SS type A sorting domain-containing protein [Saprospiraceae bacterium]|nr:T9SS type A sorting domain-containing protein [Saprospiraceae bacterium]
MRRSNSWLMVIILTGSVFYLFAKPKGPNTLLVDCPAPITLIEGSKYDTSVTGVPKVTENNGGAVTISYLEVYQKGDCKNHADLVLRIFTITNSIGEQVRCNQNITIKHLNVTDIYMPADTTIDYPDSLNDFTQKLLKLPKTLGSVKISYFDTRISQNCNIPIRVRRQWSLEDICNGQIRTGTTFLNIHKYFNSFKQFNNQSDAICVDEGFVNLSPVGDFKPYTYKWSTGDTVSFLNNKSPGSYTLTVTDRFNCTASIVYNLLSMSQRADIGGKIATDVGIRVVPDSLVFENPSLIQKYCVSQQSGIHYGFTLKTKKIGQYNYRFVKNSGARDAITTKDIILIQRHILNISRFKDTLQNIAADVNNNFNITASDITELRRLILGIKESFTNVKPWYFLRSDWRSVAKPNRPISEIEFKGINVPNFPLTNVNVFALKMGDIDLSYDGFKSETMITRAISDDVILNIKEAVFNNGNYWIPVFLNSNVPMLGIQFRLQNLKTDSLEICGLQLETSSTFMNGNSIAISWSEGIPLKWNQDLPLFYIKAGDPKDIILDPSFEMAWYDQYLQEFAIKFNKVQMNSAFGNSNLFYPNPTTDKIYFKIPNDVFQLRIYNLDGRLIQTNEVLKQQPLSTNHLIKGTYILSCSAGTNFIGSDVLIIK